MNEMKKDASRPGASGETKRGNGQRGQGAEVRDDGSSLSSIQQGIQDTAAGAAAQARDLLDKARDTASDVQDRAAGTFRQAEKTAREGYDRASQWALEGYDRAARQAEAARRRSLTEIERVQDGAARVLRENPVMIGVIGLAAGVLFGALLPRTQREDEAFGRWSDELRERGIQYATELAQQGREMVEDALSDAASGLGDRGSAQGGSPERGSNQGGSGAETAQGGAAREPAAAPV
jgi:hypothetical protein